MSTYRRQGRIRKRYLRRLRIQIEPMLREQRALFRAERRARRANGSVRGERGPEALVPAGRPLDPRRVDRR